MRNQKQTIRKIIGYINNPDEDGGFWLPNIQRPFVWSEEQICRLFDSILRNYPINTLLVWKTNKAFRRRKFIDNWKSDLRLRDFLVLEDHKKKCLVLVLENTGAFIQLPMKLHKRGTHKKPKVHIYIYINVHTALET